jgi:glycerol-3-phosphate dehydrogenase (NAD(P)+)
VTRVAIFAPGSWGTAFAMVLADSGTEAVLCARRAELAQQIETQHENPDYLPGIRLPDAVHATTDPASALAGAEFLVLAVPAQSLRENLARWAPLVGPQTVFVSLIKGIELGTCLRMSQVIGEVTGAGQDRIAVVSGPNLAREIARRQIAATVVACASRDSARALQAACHTPYFRPYTNDDVIGCELGGAVKNIIAIAIGMAVAMGQGDNTRAALMTRGLAEMARLGAALGAQPQTFAGLAGMGDLAATCTSALSRNRTFGEHLGQGMSVTQAMAHSATAEGVASCEPVLELAASRGVEMPITEVVAAVMRDGLPVADAAAMLASRTAKPEWYGP